MGTQRSSALPILAAVVMLLVVVLTAYFAGYYLRGQEESLIGASDSQDFKVRLFQSEWEAAIFAPAAKVESFCTGNHVTSAAYEGFWWGPL
jgi:hypothetical protein